MPRAEYEYREFIESHVIELHWECPSNALQGVSEASLL